jgi:hypothetical protein
MGGEEGVMAWKGGGGHGGTQQYVHRGRDIMSSVARVAGYGGAWCCVEKSRDDVGFGSTQSGSQ